MDIIEVIEGGLFTTVQDLGRYGYQRYGVPVSGAMDTYALRLANLLVGNREGAAALEITLVGPKLKFLEDSLIAVSGADLMPRLNGQPFTMWRAARVARGSVLSFHDARDGVRACLAVSGGIDVPPLMGSKATYVGAALGGLEGRALKAGDRIGGFAVSPSQLSEDTEVPPQHIPTYGHQHQLRVILGPQDDLFTPEGIDTFLAAAYTVTPQSDRVGHRLQGPPIEYIERSDIVSDGVPLGAVQVTGDGMPVILLADRGATGGYAKIATVISTDISRIVQALPGDTVTFTAITVEEAHGILREEEKAIQELKELLQTEGKAAPSKLRVTVDGQAFEVTTETGRPLSQVEEFKGQSVAFRRRVHATINDKTHTFEVEVERPK